MQQGVQMDVHREIQQCCMHLLGALKGKNQTKMMSYYVGVWYDIIVTMNKGYILTWNDILNSP